MSCNVILGGGFTGLFSALLLVEKFKQSNVVIIEASENVGGSYNSCFFSDGYYFDFGPHLIYESENEEINKLIISLLEDKEWLFLEKNDKDIPGLYFKGILQEYSHYIDLRNLDNDLYRNSIADLFINLEKSKYLPEYKSAEEYFLNKFGAVITEDIIKKIITKLWGSDIASIDWFVAKLVSMDRVVAFNEETMLDLMKSDKVRERIAYPNQYTFPSEKRPGQQRGLYPKKFGFFRIIEALKKRLESKGVKILTSTQIKSINIENNQIKSISILKNNSEQMENIDNIQHVHSTIGLMQVADYLNIKYDNTTLDKYRKVAYVFLSLKNKPKMGDLYYFYVFDNKYTTFRVTSYVNYCSDAGSTGEYPICVELHFDSSKNCESENFITVARDELLAMGIIDNANDILFSEYKFFEHGFPVPTLKNNKFYENIRKTIDEKSVANMTVGGIGLDKRLFFLHNILEDSYDALDGRF